MKINTNMMSAYISAGYKSTIPQMKLGETKDTDAEQIFDTTQKSQNTGSGFVLHISNEQDGEAIGAMCGADHSVTVYKPKDFDAANPVYKVKIWDKDGNATERMVDVSKVDPKNSDFIDMFAYTSHLTVSGKCPSAQSSFMSSSAYQHGMDERSYKDLFKENDWVSTLADALQTQYAAGNFEGYLNYKPFWDFLTRSEGTVLGKVYTKPLEESKECSNSLDSSYSDDEEQVTISTEEGLQTWYEGRTLAEWALTDPQYTDSETGFSWYVRDGKYPYMVGKDAEKFKELCQETGEPWLKKFAKMTAGAREDDVEKVAEDYAAYESENYRIVPDNEAGCFDIYNNQGERLGAFHYSDIKVRKDSATGRQFLISEHGSMSYDALALDNELKEDLRKIMGVDTLETKELQGFTLKRHSGTGIQYLVRDGEEGRGGKVLLESEADQKKYEALAQTYLNQYPNLIDSMEEAYIWADLEIKGLAQHTKDGIISMGFDGMSYNDNANNKNNWSVLFSEGTYHAVFEWLQNNKEDIQKMQKFAAWQDVFESIGSRYERIWSKEEEKQGYLNN